MSHSNPSSPAVRSSGHARRPSFNTYFDNTHVPVVAREEEELPRRESSKNLKNDVGNINYRPKISSHLKTSTTVLEDGYSNDGFGFHESHNDMHEGSDSGGTLIDKDTSGRYGSPGVPGMPVYSHKLAHSGHIARPAPRRKVAEQNPQQTRGRVMVDAVTQTLNDASTQTFDGNQIPLMDVLPQIPEDTRPIPIPTVSPSHLRRPQLAMQAGQAHHRRSVSWDPPSFDPKTKSQGMLNMLLKEKREAALQKEAELRREHELRKELEQQRQQILLREAVVSKLAAAPPIPTQTISVASPPTIAVTSPPSPLSSSPNMVLSPPNLSTSPSLGPSQLSKATHRVNAHHHRSKSDPNVIPLLLKGLRISDRTSPAIATTLNAQRSPKQDVVVHLSTTPSSSSPSSSYYAPPSRAYPITHSIHRNASSSKLGTSPSLSPSPSSSPTRDKQRELLELEMKIELKQKQLMEKGILPPQSPTHHGSGEYGNGGPSPSRRKGSLTQWSLENPQDNQIISSLLLEDIEEELEHIRQRTMDIQDKVELLERVRCAAPDPVLMLFGDNLRNSTAVVQRTPPAPRVSPPYFFSPVVTDNDDLPSLSALRPRMAKKFSTLQQAVVSPTPRGPDMSKARSLMSPSSAFMAPPPRPGSTDAVGSSEGEY